MALPAGQKRLALRLLNLEAEYTVLTAINPTTRTYEEDARIKELDFLCLAHGLPSEVKNNVLEYYIPGLEPVDITDPANHIDLSIGGAAEIDDENLEALWRLLELLDGEMGDLQLKFIWKNDTNPNDISAATKREVATNNSAPFVAIKHLR
ncbi:hypothetical protein D6D03_05085 [Aureobasidium pullulans]|nr:hypothetical protein D6D03_05085 [Aureobasidium pullulans]